MGKPPEAPKNLHFALPKTARLFLFLSFWAEHSELPDPIRETLEKMSPVLVKIKKITDLLRAPFKRCQLALK